jgi:hypothetical protein
MNTWVILVAMLAITAGLGLLALQKFRDRVVS